MDDLPLSWLTEPMTPRVSALFAGRRRVREDLEQWLVSPEPLRRRGKRVVLLCHVAERDAMDEVVCATITDLLARYGIARVRSWTLRAGAGVPRGGLRRLDDVELARSAVVKAGRTSIVDRAMLVHGWDGYAASAAWSDVRVRGPRSPWWADMMEGALALPTDVAVSALRTAGIAVGQASAAIAEVLRPVREPRTPLARAESTRLPPEEN